MLQVIAVPVLLERAITEQFPLGQQELEALTRPAMALLNFGNDHPKAGMQQGQ